MTEYGESWVEKYRPETWTDIQGNNKAVKEIRKWAENWSPGDKPRLLVGAPGTGKTSTAYVVSDELGYPINQINASSSRGSDAVERIARSINSTPSDAERQLVLLDEMDSWHHATNKTPLVEALKESRNPVIMTANEEWQVPNSFKRGAKTHEFKLQKRSRKAKLREIAEKEGLDIDKSDLQKLAERPDLRSAIGDLQTWSEQDLPAGSDGRTWERSPFEIMDDYVRGRKTSTQGMTPPDLVSWLDENLSEQFRGVEAMAAYDTLARADKWLQRARKQDYRYWKYAGELAEQTANMRLSDPYEGWVSWNSPQWRKKSTPKAQDESGEAKLYRALKSYEEGPFRMGGNYIYFRNCVLPILRNLDKEQQFELALTYRLDEDARQALGIGKREWKNWKQTEVPDDRQQSEAALNQEDAMSW